MGLAIPVSFPCFFLPPLFTTNSCLLYRFVIVSVLSMCQQTLVAKRTLKPMYNPKDATTFEFPPYLSLAEKLGGVELVV